MNHTRLVFLFALVLLLKVTSLAVAADGGIYDSDADLYAAASKQDQSAATSGNNNTTVQVQKNTVLEPVETSKHKLASREDADVALVLGTHHHHGYYNRTAVMPIVGTSLISPEGISVSNAYNLGLGLEFPMSPQFSLEAEGSYTPDARWVDNRGIPVAPPGAPLPPRPFRDFSMWTLGGNMKVYLNEYGFRPYLGGGLMARYYDGKSLPYQQAYTRWTGDAQIFAGFDYNVAYNVAIGPRAAYVVPVFNKIGYYNSPALYYAPGPYGADRDIINSSYWKLTASAKVSF